MSDFVDLSREERALYNPAFTALLTARTVQGHQTQYGRPCPVALAVLGAVMALQPAVREKLPRTTHAGVSRWVEENRTVKVAMMQNATALATVVRPGLLFALQSTLLHCTDQGLLQLSTGRLKKVITGPTDEVITIQKAAHMLGRWLPSTGSMSTVMTLLGVRP
ncbi:three component ABC system middle component [Streptomyces sp. NPDC002773]|uniref:three component ABC system middle component n=1 Tax=Streptomyces sp. NPDC002773 TaxID=3154430 RepID=UPI0033272281